MMSPLYTHENIELYHYNPKDVLNIEIMYPMVEGNVINTLDINQSSVRASDGIRVTYDYDRDGWIISQASRWSWADSEEYDSLDNPEDYQEVAFIQSWARDPDN